MIEYETETPLWRLIFRCHGSVMARSLVFAAPSALLSLLLTLFAEEPFIADAREMFGIDVAKTTVIWAAVSAPLFTLLAFRTNQAWGRFWEGTGLLHAMRGEWFDSASCLATFSLPAKTSKPDAVSNFRHTLLRLMSLCHGSALDELKVSESEDYEVIDIRGLDDETVRILTQCKMLNFNRVEVLLHMIQVLVINAQQEGVISIPPPILSRVYQTLSRGFVNLLNAKKIKDTRFPFPYAQVVALMLLTLVVFTPFVMSVLLPHRFWCTIATFGPVFAAFCINYIAGELEMPFGEDCNDLPLIKFQEEMNSSLLMLIHTSSDHVPKISEDRAHRDFESLRESLTDSRNSMQHLEKNNNRVSGIRRRSTRCGPTRCSMFAATLDSVEAGSQFSGTREGEPDWSSSDEASAGGKSNGPAQKPPTPPSAPEAPSNGVPSTGLPQKEATPPPLRSTTDEKVHSTTEAVLTYSKMHEDTGSTSVPGGFTPDGGTHSGSGPCERGHISSGERSPERSFERSDSAASGALPRQPALPDLDSQLPRFRPPTRQRLLVECVPELETHPHNFEVF
mmetsp:Transcript_83746/g.166194  ORF Transcript_83746/g.166194 Transcript_83746/m.166194 type:complete len:564 (+) Transcript_83746:49-1740(+)